MLSECTNEFHSVEKQLTTGELYNLQAYLESYEKRALNFRFQFKSTLESSGKLPAETSNAISERVDNQVLSPQETTQDFSNDPRQSPPAVPSPQPPIFLEPGEFLALLITNITRLKFFSEF